MKKSIPDRNSPIISFVSFRSITPSSKRVSTPSQSRSKGFFSPKNNNVTIQNQSKETGVSAVTREDKPLRKPQKIEIQTEPAPECQPQSNKNGRITHLLAAVLNSPKNLKKEKLTEDSKQSIDRPLSRSTLQNNISKNGPTAAETNHIKVYNDLSYREKIVSESRRGKTNGLVINTEPAEEISLTSRGENLNFVPKASTTKNKNAPSGINEGKSFQKGAAAQLSYQLNSRLPQRKKVNTSTEHSVDNKQRTTFTANSRISTVEDEPGPNPGPSTSSTRLRDRALNKIFVSINQPVALQSRIQDRKQNTTPKLGSKIKLNNFFSTTSQNLSKVVKTTPTEPDESDAVYEIADERHSGGKSHFPTNYNISQDVKHDSRVVQLNSSKRDSATPKNINITTYRPPSSQRNRENENNPTNSAEMEKKTKKVSLQDFVTKVAKGGGLSGVSTQKIQKLEKENAEKLLNKSSSNLNQQGLLRNSTSKTPKASAALEHRVFVTTTERKVLQNSSRINQSPLSGARGTSQSSFRPSTPSLTRTKGDNKANQKFFQQNKLNKPAPFIYYVTSLENHHKYYSEDDYFCQLFREHFIQTYQAMRFVDHLSDVNPDMLESKKVYLPKRRGYEDKRTVVFDLDETLIHCNESLDDPYHTKLTIQFPQGGVLEAGINIRPYALEALKELSNHFEIIVFTASHACYANEVLDYLDPKGQYVHHRLFRDSCIQTDEGIYVKDLRVLANRDLKDVILVDNAAYSFAYQIENGIPIAPYYDNSDDEELKHLIPYLKFLNSARDMREINKQTFKLHLYSQHNSLEDVLEHVIFAK